MFTPTTAIRRICSSVSYERPRLTGNGLSRRTQLVPDVAQVHDDVHAHAAVRLVVDLRRAGALDGPGERGADVRVVPGDVAHGPPLRERQRLQLGGELLRGVGLGGAGGLQLRR